VFFLTGIWMDGRFIVSMEGYWFGIFDVLLLYFPLALYLSYRYCTTRAISSPPGWTCSVPTLLRILVIIGVINHLLAVRNLVLWYDPISGLLSPAKLWWSVVVVYLAFVKPIKPLRSLELAEDNPRDVK